MRSSYHGDGFLWLNIPLELSCTLPDSALALTLGFDGTLGTKAKNPRSSVWKQESCQLRHTMGRPCWRAVPNVKENNQGRKGSVYWPSQLSYRKLRVQLSCLLLFSVLKISSCPLISTSCPFLAMLLQCKLETLHSNQITVPFHSKGLGTEWRGFEEP
jgi:hypothetical protein